MEKKQYLRLAYSYYSVGSVLVWCVKLWLLLAALHKLDMLVHIRNPSIGSLKQEDQKFKIILDNIVTPGLPGLHEALPQKKALPLNDIS